MYLMLPMASTHYPLKTGCCVWGWVFPHVYVDSFRLGLDQRSCPDPVVIFNTRWTLRDMEMFEAAAY
jgi:hypothetical protein